VKVIETLAEICTGFLLIILTVFITMLLMEGCSQQPPEYTLTIAETCDVGWIQGRISIVGMAETDLLTHHLGPGSLSPSESIRFAELLRLETALHQRLSWCERREERRKLRQVPYVSVIDGGS